MQMVENQMKIPESQILHVTKLYEQKEIDAMLERWHNPDDDPGKPRIIIATTGAMSVGLTLTEARSIIMMEPNSSAAVELQGFCRHWRQGNKNPTVHSRQLYNPDHPTENACRQRNRRRKGLGQTSTGAVAKTPGIPLPGRRVDDDLYGA
jgi:hypothetical protein